MSGEETAGHAAPPQVVAEVQSREADALEGPVSPSPRPSLYRLGDGIHRAGQIRPYRRRPEDPLYRRLEIFTSDPAESRLSGRVSEVAVPYEPLAPGPTGSIFEVLGVDGVTGQGYRRSELDHPDTLLRGGYRPSTTDPRFHQQMVYTVATLVYDAFRRALGRDLSWGFDRPDEAGARLLLSPHAIADENAFYDRARGQVSFGYYRAERDSRGRNLPAGTVFTCLCHDVVAHEVTHALLDGLRSHFLVPSHPDVLAFHEGFAHLVALFLRFSYREVVEAAVAEGGGDVTSALLTDLGRQLGQTTDLGRSRWALVSAVVRSTGSGEGDGTTGSYREGAEEHDNGAVLMSAMFEAFRTVYRRKTRRIVQLVTGGGRRELGPEDLRPEVVEALADVARKLAAQFCSLAIRAIDYCPPVDLRLGEYLRALVTADRDLVPDDPWGYRESLIDAFRRRGIYPAGVADLTEDALLWRAARSSVARPAPFDVGDGISVVDTRSGEALERLAQRVGEYVTRPEHRDAFGLLAPGPTQDGEVEPPFVESVRLSQRVGPDGQLAQDLVAEITQRLRVTGSPGFDFYGGATVILGPDGLVRYVIAKSVGSRDRLATQRSFLTGRGRGRWETEGGGDRLVPKRNLLAALHGGPPKRRAPPPATPDGPDRTG